MSNLQIAVFALCLSVAILSSGCATNVAITPDIGVVPTNDFTLGGEIDYEGSKEFLPRTVFSDTNPESLLVLRYRYDVAYGRDSVHQALPLFNPLTIVGFPIGADTVVVTGKLEILKRGSTAQTYSAVCVLDKHRTIFSEGETMSEIRKRGLLSVRDNIEAQMYVDRDLLRRHTGR